MKNLLTELQNSQNGGTGSASSIPVSRSVNFVILSSPEFANEGTEALCHFTNDLSPGEDGWAMLAPYGDYPGMATITNEDGSLKRVPALQRLDRQAADKMVTNFKSLWGRVKRYISGVPIFLGHPDGIGIGHKYADKTPKGMFADLEARPNGLFGKPVFTNEGMELLPKYPALSGRWTAEDIGEETHQGQRVKVFRPDVLKSAGLTDKPNLPVELLNEFEAEVRLPAGQPNQTADPMKKEIVIALLKKLGIEINNEATDEQVSAAVEKRAGELKATTELANEKSTIEGQLATEKETVKGKDTEISNLTKERDLVKVDFANERAAHVTLLLDTALADGRITPAQKPDWKKKLEANFTNESQALGKLAPVMKTRSATDALGGRKAEIANAQDRQRKVIELVNEAQSKNPRLSYEEAFAKVQRENAALFEAMHQPQRLETKAA